MHEKGFIHGDLKPLNIMRVAAKMKLIDLDSACECITGLTFAGLKYSSGFVPPEMVYCDDNTACVRSESLLKGHDGDSSDRDSDDDKEGFRRTESGTFVLIDASLLPFTLLQLPLLTYTFYLFCSYSAGSHVDLLRTESGVFPMGRNGESVAGQPITTIQSYAPP